MDDQLWVNVVLTLTGAGIGWVLGLFSEVGVGGVTRCLLGPKLALEFDRDAEDCWTVTEERFGTADHRTVTFVRFRVSNQKQRVARRCSPWLVRVEQKRGEAYEDVFRDNFPLVWSYCPKTGEVDVPCGVVRHFDLLKTSGDAVGYEPQLRHDVLLPARLMESFRQEARYRFTVLVAGENATRVESRVEIVFNNNGTAQVVG